MIDPHALRTLIEQWREKANEKLNPGGGRFKHSERTIATLRSCADELSALLSALPETPWQPIETAPKDGRMVLLYPSSTWVDDTECDYEVSYWDDDLQRFHQWAAPEDFKGFTHWMPLPAPPPPSEEPT